MAMQPVAGLFLLLLTPVGFNHFPVQTVAELDFSHANEADPLNDHHPGSRDVSEAGESFRLRTVAKVDNAEFLLFKSGNPTVNLVAVIYLFDRENHLPATQLAASKPINSTVLPDGTHGDVRAGQIFRFEFENGPILSPGRTYAVALQTGSPGLIGVGGKGRWGSVWLGMAGEDLYEGTTFLYAEGSYQIITDDFVFRVNGRVPPQFDAH